MKKKLFITGALVGFLTILLPYNAFAARKTELPVTMKESAYYDSILYTRTVSKFDIIKVENLGEHRKNRIYYDFDSSNGYASLNLICYDAQGQWLETLKFSVYDEYIDVSDLTAIIELCAENPTMDSDSYFYCNYINVYACDGSVLAIHDLQLPLYEKVGWSEAVDVYNINGESIKISPHRIAEYDAYGWYLPQKALFLIVQNTYNTFFYSGKYEECMSLIDDELSLFIGTNYESSMYALRTKAMNKSREVGKTPLTICEYSMGEDSIGTPETTVWFRNVSFKDIVAFRVKFDCYNIFGQLERTYYSGYYADDCYITPAEKNGFKWSLYGADSVNKLTNIRVTEVVFSDGTKWYR